MSEFLHQNKKNTSETETKLEFGFRGEDITYRLPNKSLELGFSWINGPRIYTETISKWDDGSILTSDDKKKVFIDVLQFVVKNREKPIIVINADDLSKALWEELCSINEMFINKIEYTSKEDQYEFERKMYLEFIDAGKIVEIDGVEISTEKELNDFLQKRRKNQAT